MFNFSHYSANWKHYDDSNKLVVGKMKDETAGVVIAEFLGSKAKMHSRLVDNSGNHKKTKAASRNVVATIIILNTKMFCWIRNVWETYN